MADWGAFSGALSHLDKLQLTGQPSPQDGESPFPAASLQAQNHQGHGALYPLRDLTAGAISLPGLTPPQAVTPPPMQAQSPVPWKAQSPITATGTYSTADQWESVLASVPPPLSPAAPPISPAHSWPAHTPPMSPQPPAASTPLQQLSPTSPSDFTQHGAAASPGGAAPAWKQQLQSVVVPQPQQPQPFAPPLQQPQTFAPLAPGASDAGGADAAQMTAQQQAEEEARAHLELQQEYQGNTYPSYGLAPPGSQPQVLPPARAQPGSPLGSAGSHAGSGLPSPQQQLSPGGGDAQLSLVELAYRELAQCPGGRTLLSLFCSQMCAPRGSPLPPPHPLPSPTSRGRSLLLRAPPACRYLLRPDAKEKITAAGGPHRWCTTIGLVYEHSPGNIGRETIALPTDASGRVLPPQAPLVSHDFPLKARPRPPTAPTPSRLPARFSSLVAA